VAGNRYGDEVEPRVNVVTEVGAQAAHIDRCGERRTSETLGQSRSLM
jgi:hypothetical protein